MGVAKYASGPKAICTIHHPSQVLRMQNAKGVHPGTVTELGLTTAIGLW